MITLYIEPEEDDLGDIVFLVVTDGEDVVATFETYQEAEDYCNEVDPID